jgi:HAD superfamily hydrolase (TIGR01459 family)
MTNTAAPPFVSGLSELALSYRSLLCDVWGVVHDGVEARLRSTEALARYRQGGGRIVLITNSPRLKPGIVEQFDRIGVRHDAYDDIVTSGEVSRALLTRHAGARVLHVGPERDLLFYDGLPVELSGEDDCNFISCTGLYDDETETPDDYRERLRRWAGRGLPMLCVNPDIVVERGNRLVWCAGALAQRYREHNGPTMVVGKPHEPIYEAALARLAQLAGTDIDKAGVLAIGDGLDTDVRGAVAQGIDAAFITGGIHAEIFGDRDDPDVNAVHAFLATAGLGAVALMTGLVW